jgi:hypothetical protein
MANNCRGTLQRGDNKLRAAKGEGTRWHSERREGKSKQHSPHRFGRAEGVREKKSSQKRIADKLSIVWEARKFLCFSFSLSSHRHFFIPLIFGSRFIDS